MKSSPLVFRFWYVVWFVALPLIISWIAVDRLDRMRIVDEFEPWYVLLLFALVVIVVHSVRNKLPYWQDTDPNSSYNKKRRKKNILSAIKHAEKKLKKYSRKIPPENTSKLRSHLETIKADLPYGTEEQYHEAMTQLEASVKEQLAVVLKSPNREYVESIGLAIVVALGLRLLVVEAFKIPTESMVPTLMVGDHIFVAKYQYGVSMPFTGKQLINYARPQYGDVIVFTKPTPQEQGLTNAIQDPYDGTDFIKRVVGLPGDKIQVTDSVLYVNDTPVPRCKVGRTQFKTRDFFSDTWIDGASDLWVETHGNNTYTIAETTLFDSTDPIVVPNDHVFVMGDNRDKSSDSRMWGTVPIRNVKGRAMAIWWSNERPHGFAWERFGRSIMGDPKLSATQKAALERCNNQ